MIQDMIVGQINRIDTGGLQAFDTINCSPKGRAIFFNMTLLGNKGALQID